MKFCVKCMIEKDDDNFYFRKIDEGVRFNTCKECIKIYKALNKEKIKLYQCKYDKLYYENNKESINNYSKEYYRINKIKISKYNNEYDRKRRKIDPAYRLRKDCSRMIRAVLSKNNSSIINYLPYTIQELKEHLEKQFEPWMTWQNWGLYNIITWDDNNQSTWTWQIDHIIPHSTFTYVSMEDQSFKDCWALSNLRPLSAKQNQLDGSSKIRHK